MRDGIKPTIGKRKWPVEVRLQRSEPGESVGESAPVVKVRRITNSTALAIARAAGLRDGDTASRELEASLRIRYAIVQAERLTDAATLEPVEFKTENHPTLGAIASIAVYDALDNSDAAVILVNAIAGQLAEEDKGN